MKKTRLEDVHNALHMQHQIHVDEAVRIKAMKALKDLK